MDATKDVLPYYEKYEPKNCDDNEINDIIDKAWKDYCVEMGYDFKTSNVFDWFIKATYSQKIFGNRWTKKYFRALAYFSIYDGK